MKGQISTPTRIVRLMINKLFKERNPNPDQKILDPGCGAGAFIKGILRWCNKEEIEPPHIVGIEIDPELWREALASVGHHNNVTLLKGDFLTGEFGFFDFIIGNPPYVPLEDIDERKREKYRRIFHESAKDRFDLYILFFEKALKHLKPSGRLVFITPEKFEYTLTARPLRKFLTSYSIEEIHHLKEDAFEELVTYPAITTVVAEKGGKTTICRRDGKTFVTDLPSDGSPWISDIWGNAEIEGPRTLEDICIRVSCGVATGRDEIFVMPSDEVTISLKKYAFPTLGGKELTKNGTNPSKAMICPYDKEGNLLPEEELESFLDWASNYKDELSSRYCVTKGGKKWYAFHENPPMKDMLRPKIICKDITKEPRFWADENGDLIPRHNLYYIVPKTSVPISNLLEYLNRKKVHQWLTNHCQRAANDFIRLQSYVLKKLPVPEKL